MLLQARISFASRRGAQDNPVPHAGRGCGLVDTLAPARIQRAGGARAHTQHRTGATTYLLSRKMN